ncbi:hypothetical protein V8D89_002947, partial [Ganoderma adspersum]
MEEIDYIVREEMARQQPEFIPPNLQDRLTERQRQPEEVRLRSNRLHEEVYPLRNPNGEVSQQFTATLGDIFARLMGDHEGMAMSDSREKKTNAFMCWRYCSIQHQLVLIATVPTEGGPAPCRINS